MTLGEFLQSLPSDVRVLEWGAPEFNVSLTFESGWTISIGYGPGHYCTNRWADDLLRSTLMLATMIEVAIITPDNKFYRVEGERDSVLPYCTIDRATEIVEYLRTGAPKP